MIALTLVLPLLGFAGPVDLAPETTSELNSAPVSLTPHEAVLAQVRALRNDDMESLVRSFVTDEQFDAMASAWEEERRRTPDPKENAEFTEAMARIAAPNAEAELWPDLKAGLDEMRPQMAMMMPMFEGMAQAELANQDMSADERRLAEALLNSFKSSTLQNKITDEKTARKALGIVCSTARSLQVKTLDDVYELSFEQLLARGGVALRGVKQIAGLYGIELNGWLSSFKARTVHTDGDYAVVRIDYTVFGVKDSTEVEMRRVSGRWFQQDTIDRAAEMQQR